jgi:hypothetical protein
MQYCPKDDLSKRYNAGPIAVSEVLSIGVQLAGAVESAHRQGILHRDIKPANVLTKRSGRPALTDFGIAVTTAAAEDPDAVGVSIPWSPPELLADDPVGGVPSDVYSLTATLYTLLARRSPFTIPDRSNELVDLLSRIPRLPLPPTGNPQTPRSLERLLARGMAKDPALRFPSALVLARALQDIETELTGTVTNFEFLAEDPSAALAEIPGEQADHTRIRPLVIRAQGDRQHAVRDSTLLRNRQTQVSLDGPAGASGLLTAKGSRLNAAGVSDEHTQLRGKATTGGYLDPHYLSAPVPADTVVPEPRIPSAQDDGVVQPKRPRTPLLLAVGGGLAIAGALTWIVLSQGVEPPPVPGPTTTAAPTALAIDAVVPAPAELSGQAAGDSVVFHWTNPEPQPGDSYDWRRSDLGSDEPVARVQEPTVTVPGVQQACIEVAIVRDNGTSSAHPAVGCVGQ